ncbi:hypothetical protein AX17_002694 [Amanita inopinata Kibby_2008]|nr:hypothetical protein AX17_002694 [Amanita inopinata Kibby_2008]
MLTQETRHCENLSLPFAESKETKPPAYCEAWTGSDGRDAAMVGPAPSATSTCLLPMPTAAQIHIDVKHEDIKGNFYVDPSAGRLSERSRRERQLLGDSHASFRTRQGNISINVGTTGKGEKASVLVATRNGDIDVHVLPLSVDRPRIGLDISSRQGKVVLLLPNTYSGTLQLRTRKGSLTFQPAVAEAVRTFKMTNGEVVVHIGGGVGCEGQVADCSRVSARNGDIVVGMQ